MKHFLTLLSAGLFVLASTNVDAQVTSRTNRVSFINGTGTVTLEAPGVVGLRTINIPSSVSTGSNILLSATSAPQIIAAGGLTIGAGIPFTLSGFTSGTILFAGTDGIVANDPSLSWDDINDVLSVSTISSNSLRLRNGSEYITINAPSPLSTSTITFTLPSTGGELLTSNTTSEPTFGEITLGHPTTPVQGAIIIHDNDGTTSYAQTIRSASSLTADNATITVPNTDGANAAFILSDADGAQTIATDVIFDIGNALTTTVNNEEIVLSNTDIPSTTVIDATGLTTDGSVTAPNIYGSSTNNGTLAINATSGSGSGTGDAITLNVGNNGATNAVTIDHDGEVTIPNVNITGGSISGVTLSGGSGFSGGLKLLDPTGDNFWQVNTIEQADDMTLNLPATIGMNGQVLALANVTTDVNGNKTADFVWSSASGGGNSFASNIEIGTSAPGGTTGSIDIFNAGNTSEQTITGTSGANDNDYVLPSTNATGYFVIKDNASAVADGDLLIGDATDNMYTTLAAGAGNNGKVLTVVSGVPEWTDPATVSGINASNITTGQIDNVLLDPSMTLGSAGTAGSLSLYDGDANPNEHYGTISTGSLTQNRTYDLPDYSGMLVVTDAPLAVGDLIYATSTSAWGRLAKGANNTMLSVNGSGVVGWVTAQPYDPTNVAITGGTITNVTITESNITATQLKVKGNNGNHYGQLKEDNTHAVDQQVGNNYFQYSFDPANSATGNKSAKFTTSSIAANTTRTYTLPDSDGEIMLSGSGSSPSFGSVDLSDDLGGGTYTLGGVYRDNQIAAWAEIDGIDGAVINQDFGVSSVSRTSEGVYLVNLDAQMSDYSVIVTCKGTAARVFSYEEVDSDTIRVRTFNLTGGGGGVEDCIFSVLVVGRE